MKEIFALLLLCGVFKVRVMQSLQFIAAVSIEAEIFNLLSAFAKLIFFREMIL